MEEQEKSIREIYMNDTKNLIPVAVALVKKLDIKLYNGVLYFKCGTRYINDNNKLLREISKHIQLKSTQLNEIISQIRIYGELIENSDFKLCVRNGVLSNYTIENIDYGFTPFYLDVTYKPNAYDENVDTFLNFICKDRNDMRLVIEELIGHILLINRFPHKLFFITGSGANGKSTFLEMLNNFIGDLASHIDIRSFDDGTCVASLVGKLVNIADDIDPLWIDKSKNLKTLASGNTISVRPVYAYPIDVKNTATLIFTTNEPPTFKDKSKGITRRLVIIPFENKVHEINYNLDNLLSTDNAKSYLLNLALKGIERIYNNHWQLSNSETIANATNDYYIERDNILAYLNAFPDIINKPINEVYKDYSIYTERNGNHVYSINKFSRRLSDLGYHSVTTNINGTSVKVIKVKD